MPRVLWTPVAEADLDGILFYFAFVSRSVETGERIYYELRDRIAEHSAKKVLGHRHPDAPEGWLYLKHKCWLIFYRQHPEGLEVMRVVDAVRDLPRHLREL